MDNSPVMLSQVTDVTAEHYSLESEDILGTSRARKVVRARMVATQLCRELTGENYITIGPYFGQSHIFVAFYARKVESEMREDRNLLNEVQRIRSTIIGK